MGFFFHILPHKSQGLSTRTSHLSPLTFLPWKAHNLTFCHFKQYLKIHLLEKYIKKYALTQFNLIRKNRKPVKVSNEHHLLQVTTQNYFHPWISPFDLWPLLDTHLWGSLLTWKLAVTSHFHYQSCDLHSEPEYTCCCHSTTLSPVPEKCGLSWTHCLVICSCGLIFCDPSRVEWLCIGFALLHLSWDMLAEIINVIIGPRLDSKTG